MHQNQWVLKRGSKELYALLPETRNREERAAAAGPSQEQLPENSMCSQY